MSPLSLLSSENEHMQEEASCNQTETTYRSNINNNNNSSNNNTATSGNNSDTCTNTANSLPTNNNTNISGSAKKEQIGFYFVIFFHSASPLIHSKNIPENKSKTSEASSSSLLTKQKENMTTATTLNANHKRNVKSKAQELFAPFYKGGNCNDLCENNNAQEHVNYFHTLFPAKFEVSPTTLESIALPTAFGGSTSELELVLTSLSPSSSSPSHSTIENITDVECSSSQTILSNTTHVSVNNNEQQEQQHQQHIKGVPCNCQLHQVHDKKGMLRCTHIILTSTFNTVRVINLAQVESKRVAVALVLTCPPSQSMECAFFCSHIALLKSCLHKLTYFAMRSIYRYFKVLPLFSHRNVIERRLEIDKLYEKLVECKDAINVRSMIKHDLNNFLHIRFPLPFIGLDSIITQHVFLPLFWMSDNVSKSEEQESLSQPLESSSSVVNESTLQNEVKVTTNTEANINNTHIVNSTVEEENLRAVLAWSVGKATPLSSALFEALSYVLEFDASFASAFVVSLCSSRYLKNIDDDDVYKDDVYQDYWETIKENDLERDVCVRSTIETERANTKANTLRKDKLENVQIIVECSNDAKLALSLLIIAAFFWRPELSDTAQPSCFAQTTQCISSSSSSSELLWLEELEERCAERSFINTIAGLVPQNKKTNETTESTKDNVVINVPIQWVCHSLSAANNNNINISVNEVSELQYITKYVTPYCTFDKLYLVIPHKHTCQEVLIERNIMTTVTVDMNVELNKSKTNNHKKSSSNTSTTNCRIVENPFHCIVKHYKEINANNEVTNLLHEVLLIHKRTDGVVSVTQTLPRMMYWWQSQQKEVPFAQ